MNLNTSHDTREFCCGSIAASRHVLKEALQVLAERLGLKIRIATIRHYCSKHNPIEHRLFLHIMRACQGVVFHSVAIAKQFMEKTKTCRGLQVTVDILTGVYVTGKSCAENFLEKMRIIFETNFLAGTTGQPYKQSDLGKLLLTKSIMTFSTISNIGGYLIGFYAIWQFHENHQHLPFHARSQIKSKRLQEKT
jgi:hypothetical protein